jgi:hypothetical protein
MAKSFPAQVISTARNLLVCIGIFASGFSTAAEITLPSYNAIYTTKFSGFNIEGYRSLRRGPDGIYTLNMKAKALMMTMTEESHFSISVGKLMPLRYQYEFSKPIGSDRKQSIKFNWASMQIEALYKKPWGLPLSMGISDRLNVLTALRVHLLTNGVSNYRARIADKGKLKEYDIVPAGSEILKTPMGEIETIVLERQGDDKVTRFWLAPNMDYQLIRFVQEESDGDEYELNIKSIEFAPGEDPTKLTTRSA